METKLTLKEIEKALLEYNAKSEYKQASIVMVRSIFKVKSQLNNLIKPAVSGSLICGCGKPSVKHTCKNCKGLLNYH